MATPRRRSREDGHRDDPPEALLAGPERDRAVLRGRALEKLVAAQLPRCGSVRLGSVTFAFHARVQR